MIWISRCCWGLRDIDLCLGAFLGEKKGGRMATSTAERFQLGGCVPPPRSESKWIQRALGCPMSWKLRVASVQMRSTADRDANLATVAELTARAAGEGAQLVALPENFSFLGRHE